MQENDNNKLEETTAELKAPLKVDNENPIDVKDSVAEEIRKPKRTLIIATVEDEDSSLLNSVLKFNLPPESEFDVEITQMDESEVERFIQRRASVASEKSVEEYVAHEPNKRSAKELAMSIERNMNSRGKFFELTKLYKRMQGGKAQADKTIATLELFGLAEISEKPNGKKYVKMIIADEDIVDNRLYLLSKQVNLVNSIVKELVEISLKETSSSALQLEMSEEMEKILKPLKYGATDSDTKA